MGYLILFELRKKKKVWSGKVDFRFISFCPFLFEKFKKLKMNIHIRLEMKFREDEEKN